MKLPDWLAKEGMTQQAFADRIGVTQGRVSQICAGGTDSLRLAGKIVEETGGEVALADLIMEAAE